MVDPSASPLATDAAAIMPPAPSRFSTITGWPRFACNRSVSARATVSEALPGVVPEIRRMDLVPNVCAAPVLAASSTATRHDRKTPCFIAPSSVGVASTPGQALAGDAVAADKSWQDAPRSGKERLDRILRYGADVFHHRTAVDETPHRPVEHAA